MRLLVSFFFQVGDILADKVMYIAEVINRQDYVPIMYTRVRILNLCRRRDTKWLTDGVLPLWFFFRRTWT